MSSLTISNLSLAQSLSVALRAEKAKLNQLTEQLSSGDKYNDLTNYSASEARKLMNLRAAGTQREAYIQVIQTVNVNLSIYDTTLTDLEAIVTNAQTIASNSQTYSESVASNVYSLATSFLKSATADLNQTVNGRYIYSGSRYTTQAVQDLSTLDISTLSTTIHTDEETLPPYDWEYGQGETANVRAYTKDRATVNSGHTVTYGITSNDPAMQKMVIGLRYLQAAGTATDSATYDSYIKQALTSLTESLSELQSMHTMVVNNINVMDSVQKTQEKSIASLVNQLENIEAVDTTQISVEITALEAILQASYSVTGSVLKLSLTNYL